ncbi:Protein of unknown function [Sanguibacter gelidistatuariae]|uniref:DUF3000 domain-containing protein n=1 Tax=Sanguibacter gelidistatuariae TaxID=1814289 RepID=A0A1G6RN86_9MICO|nr:DUF3000 domain-containing protein [Sanguibacter gelidistatuariae]SDD05406.1 Protein of unknown function [Sanguibacter gelidistatuariae]
MNAADAEIPMVFARALASLRSAATRSGLLLREVPGPTRVAPYAVALTGSLLRPGADDDDLADGRFIVLHDPDGQADWQGTFRVVTLVRAEVDTDMGVDPLLNEVAWTWMTDSLADHVGDVDALGGTVTRVVSQTFGVMAERAGSVELEIRASWTPRTPDLGDHLLAWEQMLAAAAGVPRLPDGVSAIHRRR